MLSINFQICVLILFICSPKDDLEFSIVRENIREKLSVSYPFFK